MRDIRLYRVASVCFKPINCGDKIRKLGTVQLGFRFAMNTYQLHQAIVENDLKKVKSLLSKPIDVNMIVSRETAATKAFNAGAANVIDAIIENPDFNPNAGNQFDRTPLFFAASKGDLRVARHLLELGACVDQPDILGVTPLSAAAWYDHVEMARLLVQHGAQINKASYRGETALYRACVNDSYRMARFLIENGCDVNCCTNETHNHPGHTSLMAALLGTNYNVFSSMPKKNISEMVTVIELLIEKGCDLNHRDFRGRTALSQAVLSNNVCATCILLDSGCKVSIPDNLGRDALRWSLDKEQQRHYISKLLILYGATMDPFLSSEECDGTLGLLQASREYTLGTIFERQQVQQAFIAASNPYSVELCRNNISDHVDSSNKELYELICHLKITLSSCCKFAIRKYVGDNALNKINTLPIPNSLKCYLNLGQQTPQLLPKKVNELYVAVGERNIDRIGSLLSSGTSPFAHVCGRLPMTLAAELGHADVIDLLLKAGCSPDQADASGDLPLNLAVTFGHADVVKVLLKHGVNLEQRNSGHRTPLLEAAFKGHDDIFKLLLEADCDVNATQPDGVSVLHFVAGNGHKTFVRLLVDMNVDCNTVDRKGSSAMHFAASFGRLYHDSLRLVALYDDTRDIDHVGVAKELLKAGCNVDLQNSHRQTAIDVAKAAFNPIKKEMVSVLSQNGWQ